MQDFYVYSLFIFWAWLNFLIRYWCHWVQDLKNVPQVVVDLCEKSILGECSYWELKKQKTKSSVLYFLLPVVACDTIVYMIWTFFCQTHETVFIELQYFNKIGVTIVATLFSSIRGGSASYIGCFWDSTLLSKTWLMLSISATCCMVLCFCCCCFLLLFVCFLHQCDFRCVFLY